MTPKLLIRKQFLTMLIYRSNEIKQKALKKQLQKKVNTKYNVHDSLTSKLKIILEELIYRSNKTII